MLGHIATCVLCGDQLRDSDPEWMRRFRAGKQIAQRIAWELSP